MVALVIIAALLLISLDSFKQAKNHLKFFTLPEKLMNMGVDEDQNEYEYYEDDYYDDHLEEPVIQQKYAGALDLKL